ncbi:MAG: response regulator transcription factor [Planctomycetota bacterium]|nr:response regulator transcription factor [Planctomycetota bacterium]
MQGRKHVLVVDDERDIVDVLAYNLQRSGYEVSTAGTGRQALELLAARPVDLIILDVMLPELSGTEVASRVRTNPLTTSIPIVMLTAKTEEIDEIVGLTVGADDYITKPFSAKVLMARVDAILRRATKPQVTNFVARMGPVDVNTETHQAALNGEPMKLTLTEFRLLAALVSGGGRVLSRSSLMTKAMGPGVTVTERTIDVHMTSIRKKLGDYAGMIKTVRGVGYRMTLEAEPSGVELNF